jgi:septal ring factor EnvC (AmiA/AmiB activator)
MSQLSKVTYSRQQWKHKATQRGDRERSQRKQIARISAERDRTTKALKATEGRLQHSEAQLQQSETQLQRQLTQPKVEVVLVSLQLF